jgi:hypothetical protein
MALLVTQSVYDAAMAVVQAHKTDPGDRYRLPLAVADALPPDVRQAALWLANGVIVGITPEVRALNEMEEQQARRLAVGFLQPDGSPNHDLTAPEVERSVGDLDPEILREVLRLVFPGERSSPTPGKLWGHPWAGIDSESDRENAVGEESEIARDIRLRLGAIKPGRDGRVRKKGEGF